MSQGIIRPLIARAEDTIRQPFDFTKPLGRKVTQRDVTIGAIEREKARQEEVIMRRKEADDKAYAEEIQRQLFEEDLANLTESDTDSPPHVSPLHVSPTTTMLSKRAGKRQRTSDDSQSEPIRKMRKRSKADKRFSLNSP
jgi:hypothetical protein